MSDDQPGQPDSLTLYIGLGILGVVFVLPTIVFLVAGIIWRLT